MKKRIWLLVFTISALAYGYDGQKIYNKNELILKDYKMVEIKTGRSANGVLISYESSSYMTTPPRIISETPYVKGLKHGIEREYYGSGITYARCDLTGRVLLIFKDASGHIRSETPFVNGEKYGIERHYYRSGELDWEKTQGYHNGTDRNDINRKNIDRKYDERVCDNQPMILHYERYIDENGDYVEKDYYNSGRIEMEKRNGFRKWYSESGQLTSTDHD